MNNFFFRNSLLPTSISNMRNVTVEVPIPPECVTTTTSPWPDFARPTQRATILWDDSHLAVIRQSDPHIVSPKTITDGPGGYKIKKKNKCEAVDFIYFKAESEKMIADFFYLWDLWGLHRNFLRE